jgi:dolichol-phosphate mannosyltransferase
VTTKVSLGRVPGRAPKDTSESVGGVREDEPNGRLDLSVVVPVYNEGERIVRVMRSWMGMLASENVEFRMVVLNDGSTDDTSSQLEVFKDDYGVEVIERGHVGRGPTVLAGYKRAVELADWVFQCDSNGEIKPDHFPMLWRSRKKFDALFGVRSERSQALSRRIVNACCNLTVRMLYGRGVKDANTPYRLIRASLLRQILDQIPPNTFAPNAIISGAVVKARARIMNHPVYCAPREKARSSLARWKLLRSSILAFWQTLRCRPRVRAASGRS